MTGIEALFLGWLVWIIASREPDAPDIDIDIYIEMPDHEHLHEPKPKPTRSQYSEQTATRADYHRR